MIDQDSALLWITSFTLFASLVAPILNTVPKQQSFRAMTGAHLANPIRGDLGYAHWPHLENLIHFPIGHQISGPLGQEDVWTNFTLTVTKFVFSNSGNFMAKANPPKPRSCPKWPGGQWLGPNFSAYLEPNLFYRFLCLLRSRVARTHFKNVGFLVLKN